MKFLTSVYREALYKDFKSSVTQANAYNLQQVVYENHTVFGNLYKFENFRNVFSIPPVSSETVSFMTFWKGVESVLEGEHEGVNLTMYDSLQKSCFVDDKYVDTLRFFRDEILKNEVCLTKTELVESINKSQKNSDLQEFWEKVLDNTMKIFKDEEVSVLDISNMVFSFFLKKYEGDLYLASEMEALTTSLSADGDFNGESKSSVTESPLEYQEQFGDSDMDFKFDESDNSWNYEYKYRKLLFDLENSLPKFYTYYSDAKTELAVSKQEIKSLMETNDTLVDRFSKERMDLEEKNSLLQKEMDLLTEKNGQLNQLLLSRDSEIESLTNKVSEFTDLLESSDSHKLSQELKVYMAKCDGLQKTNDGLKSTIKQLESLVESLKMEQERTLEKNREEGESIEVLVTERDSLREKLDETDSKYSKLMEEIKNLTLNNENMASDLLDYKSQIYRYSENEMKLNNENLRLINEIKNLKRENHLLESEFKSLREENDAISKELIELKQKIDSSSEKNDKSKDRSVELDSYKLKISEMESNMQELGNINEHLKEKLNDVIRENINLVAKLELMDMPNQQNATNKLIDIIEKYKDVQSPLSYESETTDYDFSDPSEPSTVENRLKINPDLAETRRLNTLNAIKFGLVKTNTPRNEVAQDLHHENRIIYRKTSSLPRSVSVRDESGDENYYDHLSLSNYDDLGISDGEDKPDILKNFISFLSKRLNSN